MIEKLAHLGRWRRRKVMTVEMRTVARDTSSQFSFCLLLRRVSRLSSAALSFLLVEIVFECGERRVRSQMVLS